MKRYILYIILFILFLPFMFIAPHEEGNIITYLLKLVLPISIVLVFWVNFRWFLPRFQQTGNRWQLIMRNAAVILSCIAMLSVVHTFEFQNMRNRPEAEVTHHRPPHRRPEPGFDYFAIFIGMKDGLYLLLGFFMAYYILSQRRVARLQQEKQEAETARQAAELCGLRNQVSPHFLLNTLNSIYSLSLMGDERTSDAIIRLSKLLRHTLYETDGDSVSLVSEANFMQAYVELMRLRLTDNVHIRLDLSVSPQSTTEIAPHIILSLLENAFKHGTDSDHPCHVDIMLREDDENILVRMSNSNYPKGQEDRSGHGIGLQLVRKRLEHSYPNRYVWTYGVQQDNWITELTIRKH